jgi:AcrR family transcriptional regulator
MKEGAAPNKHQRKTETMRRKLLKSAQRIFARHGFEAARIEEIAAHAGHTRGAFYAHFKSKEDLFFALLEQQAYEHLAKIERLFESCRTSEEQLRALRDYYTGRATDRQWSMLMLEFKLFAVRHPRLRDKLAQVHRRIRASIMFEIKDLLLPCLSCDRASEDARRIALEAALHGLVLEHAYDPRTISEDQLAVILRQMFDMLTSVETPSSQVRL